MYIITTNKKIIINLELGTEYQLNTLNMIFENPYFENLFFSLFDGELTQKETVYVLAILADDDTNLNMDEVLLKHEVLANEDLWYERIMIEVDPQIKKHLGLLAREPRIKRDFRILLRKLGCLPRNLKKTSKKLTKKQRTKKNGSSLTVTDETMLKFFNKEANQSETIAVLIEATQDSTIKLQIEDADKNEKLGNDTRFLLKKLKVLSQ